MEPLSITAGTIAVLTASANVSKLLRKALKLKQAPDVLIALNNEVSDLSL